MRPWFLRSTIIAFTILFYVSSAMALPMALTGRGSGTETGAAGSCNNASTNGCTGTNCDCYQFTGTGTATAGVGNVNITTDFVLFKNTTVGNLACEAASGVLLLTQKAKSANVLALDYVGASCLTSDTSTQVVFNGSYAVNGSLSLGKFADASGSGTFTASVGVTGTATLGNINGTLQLSTSH